MKIAIIGEYDSISYPIIKVMLGRLILPTDVIIASSENSIAIEYATETCIDSSILGNSLDDKTIELITKRCDYAIAFWNGKDASIKKLMNSLHKNKKNVIQFALNIGLHEYADLIPDNILSIDREDMNV